MPAYHLADLTTITTYGSNPQDIFRYPRIGNQKTQFHDSLPGGNSILYLGAGNEGVVRSIFFTGNCELTNWTDTDDYELRIYTDAGNISDLTAPPSANLTATIPLGILLGGVYNAETGDIAPITNSVMSYAQNRNEDASFRNPIVRLNLPMPFEDGILIQVWYRPTNTVNTDFTTFFWSTYELGENTFPYKNWRLKAAEARFTSPGTSEDTFMTVSSGPGMLVGIWAALRGALVPSGYSWNFSERNWLFYFGGEASPSWQNSGMEDIFGVNGYYYHFGKQIHPEWGTTYYDGATATAESYSLFTQVPLTWSDGIRGAIDVSDYAGSDCIGNILTLYYAPK